MRPAARRFSRWLVLVFAIGVVAAVAGRTTRAEVAAQAPGVAALQLQIQTLEARLKKLEDRLEKPLTVKAPFTVTTEAGQTMFAVKAANGPELTLGSDAAPALRVSHKGGTALLELREGKYVGAIQASTSNAVVLAGDADRYARLVTAPGSAGAEVSEGANRVANLGIFSEFGPRLRLVDGGKQIFRVQGSNGNELVLGEDAAPALKVAATPQETSLRLQHGNSLMLAAAKQNGDVVVSALSQTGSHAGLQALAAGPSVVVDSGGQNPSESAFLSLDKSGPRLTLSRSGKLSALLGSAEGMHTGLRIYDPQGGLALAAGLGIGAEPRAGLTLWRNDEEASATLSTTDAGEGLLEIYRPGKQLAAQLGRMEQGKATALRIYDTTGQVALGAGIDVDGEAAVRIANQGKLVANMTAEKSGHGRIDIVNNNRSVVSINNSSKNGDGVVEIFDRGNFSILASIGSGGGEGLVELFRARDKLAAQLGAPSGKATALRIFDSAGKVGVGAGIDEYGQHAVRVATNGQFIAGMTARPDGFGSLDIVARGKIVASLNSLDRPGQGLVVVRNSAGEGVAALGLAKNGTGGNVTLFDSAGQGVFSAGNATTGWGEACVTRSTGRSHCLGISLPGIGGGGGRRDPPYRFR